MATWITTAGVYEQNHASTVMQAWDVIVVWALAGVHPPVLCRNPPLPHFPQQHWRSCWRWRTTGKCPAPPGLMVPCNTSPNYTRSVSAITAPKLFLSFQNSNLFKSARHWDVISSVLRIKRLSKMCICKSQPPKIVVTYFLLQGIQESWDWMSCLICFPG